MTFSGSAKEVAFTQQLDTSAENAYRKKLQQEEKNIQNALAEEVEGIRKSTGDIEQLAKLAPTIQGMLFDQQGRIDKRHEEEGLALAYENWRAHKDTAFGQAEKAAHEAKVAEVKDLDKSSIKLATEADKIGAHDQAKGFRQMSPMNKRQKYGYQVGLARIAAAEYKPWLLNQLATNDTFQVTLADGRVITPKEAKGNYEKLQAANQLQTRLFFHEFGLQGVDRGILTYEAFPAMHRADVEVEAGIRKQSMIDDSHEARIEAVAQFDEDEDVMRLHTIISGTVDERGIPYGNARAWDFVFNNLKEMMNAGMTDDALEGILAQESHIPGKSIGEAFGKTRVKNMRDELVKHNVTNYRENEAARSMQREQESSSLYKKAVEEKWDKEKVRDEQFEFYKKWGKPSTELDNYSTKFSPSVRKRAELQEDMNEARKRMLVNEDMVRNLPVEMWNEWLPIAEEQEKLRQEGQFGRRERTIKGLVTGNDYIKVSADGSISGDADIVIEALQEKFRLRFTELVSGPQPLPPKQAADQAYIEVSNEFKTGSIDPSSEWFIDPVKGFDNYLKSIAPKADAVTESDNARAELLQRVLDGRQVHGDAVWDEVPGLLGGVEQHKEWEKGFGKFGWKLPAIFNYIGAQTGDRPWDIYNRSRETLGLPALLSPTDETIKTNVSPELQSNLGPYNRGSGSVRALSSIGSFQTSLIPRGLGEPLQAATEASGLGEYTPIIAGIIEAESLWEDPEAIETTVNNINTLIENGIEVEQLISAYTESNGTNFLKSAVKYGYGGGGSGTWNNPDLMRNTWKMRT